MSRAVFIVRTKPWPSLQKAKLSITNAEQISVRENSRSMTS